MDEKAVLPLSKERVIEALKSLELRYFIDSDGDIGFFISETCIFFSFDGKDKEILGMHVNPFRDVPMSELPQLQNFINVWNGRCYWPRAFTSVNDEGILRVRSDDAFDYEAGVSHIQLCEHIRRVTATVTQLYRELDDARSRGWEE